MEITPKLDYCKISLQLRITGENKLLAITNIEKITNSNEITRHFLEVIAQKLKRKHGEINEIS
jgi:hypothetical protein